MVSIGIGVEGRSNGSMENIGSRPKRAGWMIQGKEKNILVDWQIRGALGEEARNTVRGRHRALKVGSQSQNLNILLKRHPRDRLD